MTSLNRKLIRELRRIWAQALAIALVIACGVAVVVMAYGVLRSLEETRTAYYERYSFGDIFANVTRAPSSLAARIAAIPGVRQVEDRVVGRAILDLPGFSFPITGQLVSLPGSGEARLNRTVLRKGRMPHPGRNDEVLLSEAFANAHKLNPGARLSAIVHGRRQAFSVVGIVLSPEYVYAIDPGSIVPDDRRFGVLWLHREGLAAAYNLDGAFNEISLTLRLGASEQAVIAALDRELAPFGGTGAFSRRDQVSNWFLSGELDQLSIMVRFVPSIFLAVALFLLHTAMSRLIDTERHEIGLLKAFGYSDASVAWHYAKLALAISAVGIAIGFALGTYFGNLMTLMYVRFFHFPFLTFVFSPEVYAAAAFFACATALAGVFLPALGAARLPPAVAMLPPSPPRYRSSLIERLGLSAALTGAARMVLRHILRWPLRSGLTVASMAMAGALYISSSFALDSMDLLLDVDFTRAQRQDLTVTFNEKAPARVLAELAAIPGVIRVEAMRQAAARLRNGHLSRREAITGIDPGDDLARLLDSRLNPVSPPPEGLALSTGLASHLALKPGDMVRIEFLEGLRRVIDVPVVQLVEQYIGNGAYMDAATLDRHLGQGPRLSGARLLIDAEAEGAIFARLKSLPQIAGVSARKAARELLRSTIAENLTLMTLFNVGFAALIALGVVYNAARISLSERGRELASLMVLGYSRFQAAAILVGEIAILTLVALPLGCLAGWGLAALLASAYETELYRLPLVISGATYGAAVLVVSISAILSAAVVARRVARFDLVSVLKTRE